MFVCSDSIMLIRAFQNCARFKDQMKNGNWASLELNYIEVTVVFKSPLKHFTQSQRPKLATSKISWALKCLNWPKNPDSSHRSEQINFTSKPNLETIEPQKTKRTSEPNQVWPNTNGNFIWLYHKIMIRGQNNKLSCFSCTLRLHKAVIKIMIGVLLIFVVLILLIWFFSSLLLIFWLWLLWFFLNFFLSKFWAANKLNCAS